MEYLVFVIYLIVVTQWIFEKDKSNTKDSTSIANGHSYYRFKGTANLLFGLIGLVIFNFLLRDKGIIPTWLFWTGFVGFVLIIISGMIYIIKMFTIQP